MTNVIRRRSRYREWCYQTIARTVKLWRVYSSKRSVFTEPKARFWNFVLQREPYSRSQYQSPTKFASNMRLPMIFTEVTKCVLQMLICCPLNVLLWFNAVLNRVMNVCAYNLCTIFACLTEGVSLFSTRIWIKLKSALWFMQHVVILLISVINSYYSTSCLLVLSFLKHSVTTVWLL